MKNICGGQADLLFVPEQHNISIFDAITGKPIFTRIRTLKNQCYILFYSLLEN